jgi:mono/diheme cytochrome c family protein
MRRPLGRRLAGLGTALVLMSIWEFSKGTASTTANQNVSQDSPILAGRTLFVARCARCHDENGGKKLADGKSLIERLSTKDDLKAALAGRLKGLTDEQRTAMVAYVGSLVDALRASPGAKTSPPGAD